MHLRLAVESIRNPIPDRFYEDGDGDEGHDEDADADDGDDDDDGEHTGVESHHDLRDVQPAFSLLQEELLSLRSDVSFYTDKIHHERMRETTVH
jgi:hypothetical protein